MIVHIFKKNAPADSNAMNIECNRITMFSNGERYRYPGQAVLVMGTLPHLNVLPMKDIDWYWVEEN